MKNAAYFQQTAFIKKRFKNRAIKPKQINLFYYKTMNANFDLLNSKQKAKFVSDINRLFGDDFHMLEYWSKKLKCSVKDSIQGLELIIP